GCGLRCDGAERLVDLMGNGCGQFTHCRQPGNMRDICLRIALPKCGSQQLRETAFPVGDGASLTWCAIRIVRRGPRIRHVGHGLTYCSWWGASGEWFGRS